MKENQIVMKTDFEGVKPPVRGKVRDIYDLGDKLLIVATDRISAFDVVLPEGIPGKGRVLNKIERYNTEPSDFHRSGRLPGSISKVRQYPRRKEHARQENETSSYRVRSQRIYHRFGMEGISENRLGLRNSPARGACRVLEAANSYFYPRNQGRGR
jgi:hypothetical protein